MDSVLVGVSPILYRFDLLAGARASLAQDREVTDHKMITTDPV
jgi:hypothetical protein